MEAAHERQAGRQRLSGMTCVAEQWITARFKCFAAAAIIALWFVSQTIQFTFLPVYANLALAVSLDESGYIMLAAMWLVLNNTLRIFCLYSGWFIMADGLADVFKSKRITWLLPPFAIFMSYFGPALLHFPSIPPFGVPAFISLCRVLGEQFFSRDMSSAGYKFPVLAAAVFSIQWLDIIPALTPYGFGWGELSLTLKNVAVLMKRDYLLNTICGLAFCSSAAAALLLARLFVSYEKQLRQLRMLRSRERELMRAHTEQSRMRLYQEMQYLVHDLKRPLTTIMGLADLLSMSRDAATASHSRAILEAAERMDMMIGEIKNPDSVRESTVEEIVNYAMAQVRVLPWGPSVAVDVPEKAARAELSINVIRFSRVLVNLLDNARHAASPREPFVALRARLTDEGVDFIIEDNGPGFAEPEAGKKSSWGSSGLGLSFVRDMLANCGGTLSYGLRDGGGAACVVRIPVNKRKEGRA